MTWSSWYLPSNFPNHLNLILRLSDMYTMTNIICMDIARCPRSLLESPDEVLLVFWWDHAI